MHSNSPEQQGELFSAQEQWRLRSPAGTYSSTGNLELSLATLEQWKLPIRTYQQQQRYAVQQPSLFPVAEAHPALIVDPWALPQHNPLFWRQKRIGGDRPAFYFVMDYAYPLLLYVGETGCGQHRWQQEHDCKRYVAHYLFAHRQNKLATEVGIAFDYRAPANRKQRQQQERQLITYWKSPFNKENRQYWQTPFVGES
ncbi:GIY-YIG nuclease family protein [Parathermosynechococcus lividus]